MDVRTAVALAVTVGREVDLSACAYGPATRDRFLSGPMGYYSFLAGLAQVTEARGVVEIGTHYGGSARAFAEGQRAADVQPNVLTFDVEDRSGNPVRGEPGIQRVLADVRDPAGAERLTGWAAQTTADIVYIDALKDQDFLEETIAATAHVGARWLVLDDILANTGMRAAWAALRDEYGARAISLDDVALNIRSSNYGQGVVALTDDAFAGLTADHLRAVQQDRWSDLVRAATASPTLDPPAGQRERAEELTVLHEAVGRLRGEGEIVVAGAASNVTSATLASALADAVAKGPELAGISVNVVAPFLMDASVAKARGDDVTERRTTFLPDFRAALGDAAPFVNTIAGDASSRRWTGRPIELLVVDWHREHTELAQVWRELLPYCIPGRSLLVVQGLGGQESPYLTAALGRLLPYLEVVGFAPDSLVLGPVQSPPANALDGLDHRRMDGWWDDIDRLDAAIDDRLGDRRAHQQVERSRAMLRKRLGQG